MHIFTVLKERIDFTSENDEGRSLCGFVAISSFVVGLVVATECLSMSRRHVLLSSGFDNGEYHLSVLSNIQIHANGCEGVMDILL